MKSGNSETIIEIAFTMMSARVEMSKCSDKEECIAEMDKLLGKLSELIDKLK